MDIGDQEKDLKDQLSKVGKAMFECGYKPIDELAISVVPVGNSFGSIMGKAYR